jgi:flagellin-like hook-associated protein FlgL
MAWLPKPLILLCFLVRMNNSITTLASSLQSAVNDVQARLEATHTQIADGKQPLSKQQASVVARLSNQATSQDAVQGNITNANNIIDITQTGLSSISSILAQMQSLATQVSNGVFNSVDQTHLFTQFASLNRQIGQIAANTSLNGNNLLNGSQTLSVVSGTDGVNNQTTLIQGIDISRLQTALNNLSFAVSTQNLSPITTRVGTPSVYAQQTVNLSDLDAGNSATIGGLTLTTKTNLTAAELATIFANRIANGRDVDSSLGTFSGTFIGGFTGASAGKTLTLTGTSFGPMATITASEMVSGAANAPSAIALINQFISQISSTQASLSAASTNLNSALDKSTKLVTSSQKTVDDIQNIDLTALQASLQALSTQQSLDFQVISQMNNAASSLLAIFR